MCLRLVQGELEILPPVAIATCASAAAEACKIPHPKAFLRASSQTLGMENFAAVEFPIKVVGRVDTGL